MNPSIATLFFVNSPFTLQRLSTRKPLPRCRNIKKTTQVNKSQTPVQMGLIPFIPNWAVLAGWAYGAYRFYLGFDRTSYQSSFRIPLALAWPILFAVNSNYRKNFTRSLKASDDDY